MGASRNAKVFCPGPSLIQFKSPAQKSTRDALFFGVNRAVEAVAYDYWVALDKHTIETVKPLGSPGLITWHSNIGKVSREVFRGYQYPARAGELPGREVHWLSYSTLTAIVAAYKFGARVITLHGCDMTGVADWDGKQFVHVNRTEKRWTKERKYLDMLTEWLRQNGAEVKIK